MQMFFRKALDTLPLRKPNETGKYLDNMMDKQFTKRIGDANQHGWSKQN